MINGNALLSELQIPYSGLDQAGTDALANAAIAIWRARKNTIAYHSPANLPLPSNLPGLIPMPGMTMQQAIETLAQSSWSLFQSSVVDAMQAANLNFIAAFKAGDIPAVHSAVDAINALQPLTKQPFFVPWQTDYRILLTAPGVVGQLAQQLEGQQSDTGNVVLFDPAQADPIMAANGVSA